MNRRNFLKSIATVCGAAVVCPVELLKGKTEHEILLEKFRAAFKATKFKPLVPKGTKTIITQGRQGRSGWIITKARQQGFSNFTREYMLKAYQGQYYDETIQTTH